MKSLLAVLFFLLAASAHAQSVTINGSAPANCTVVAGTLYCTAATLAWSKGAASYERYAIYRRKSDSCTGTDSVWPGIQMVCPVIGTSSGTVYPAISASGCTAYWWYYLVGSNKICATMQEGDGQTQVLAETYVAISE